MSRKSVAVDPVWRDGTPVTAHWDAQMCCEHERAGEQARSVHGKYGMVVGRQPAGGSGVVRTAADWSECGYDRWWNDIQHPGPSKRRRRSLGM